MTQKRYCRACGRPLREKKLKAFCTTLCRKLMWNGKREAKQPTPDGLAAIAVNQILDLDREMEYAPLWRKAEIRAQIQELSKVVG